MMLTKRNFEEIFAQIFTIFDAFFIVFKHLSSPMVHSTLKNKQIFKIMRENVFKKKFMVLFMFIM